MIDTTDRPAPLKRTLPVIRWPGGKTRLLKHILPLIPEHTCYCEPFAGGLAVLLAKPRSKIEVVNDLNGDLVALYRCAQYHCEELCRELEFMVCSRQSLKDYVQQPGLTDIQRAARFLMRNKSSFAGNMKSFAVSKLSGGAANASRARLADLLRALNRRMDTVSVEHQSYEQCLANYDAPTTFFFVDPPYLNAKVQTYRGWTEAEMKQLAERLDALQGRWVLTVDDSPFNRALFARHRITAVVRPNGCLNQKEARNRREFGELVIEQER